MEENKQENKQQPQGHVLTRDEIMKFAQAGSIPLDGLVSSKTRRKMMKKYDREAIETYLANPQANESKLREIIDFLITESPQFAKLLLYMPSMAVITPFLKQRLGNYSDKKEDKKLSDYYKVANYADDLNMKETGYKILIDVYRYGIFYGIETSDDYVKKLNPDYCKIIGESKTGLEIAFDFSFFDGNEYILDNAYPKVFRKLYNDYKAGKVPLEGLKLQKNWQPIPLDITFVVKYDPSNLLYSIPPYINIFSFIYDIDEYRSIVKIGEESRNYTLIGLKVPQLSNAQTSDQFAVSTDMIDATCISLENSLPDNIGYFISPGMEINTVRANENSTSSTDLVNNAVKNMWSAVGVSDTLFGIENTTGTTLSFSIKTDENELFQLYRQLERHWNYKVKSKNKNFRLMLLDTTQFNLKDMVNMFSSQASLGIPVALAIPTLLGMDLSDVQDLSAMQEMLNIYEEWRPLKSAYQTTNDDEGGRPEKDDKDLTESGNKSRDYK